MCKSDTLYNSIEALDSLEQFLIDVYNDKKDNKNNIKDTRLLNHIQILINKLLILSFKELVIEKPDKDTYKSRLFNVDVSLIADTVAKRNHDGSYSIGETRFKDAEEVIAKIRNKLAHSDYQISDDVSGLLINFVDRDEFVSLEELNQFTVNLFSAQFVPRKTNHYNRCLFFTPYYDEDFTLGRSSKRYIVDRLEKFDLLVLEFTKDDGGNLPYELYPAIDDYLQMLQRAMSLQHFKSSKDKLDFVKDIANKLAVIMKNEIKKYGISTNVYFRNLTYKEAQETYDLIYKSHNFNKDNTIKTDDLLRYAARKFDSKFNKINTFGQALTLLYIISTLKLNPLMNEYEIEEILYNDADFRPKKCRVDHDLIGVVQLLKLINYTYIIENFKLDYSSFNLDTISPKVFERDYSKEQELVTKMSGIINRITELKDKISKKCNEYDHMKKKDNISPERLKVVNNNIISLRKALGAETKAYKALDEEIFEYYLDHEEHYDHNYNKELFTRIRDSLSHGNIEIIPNGPIENTVVRFMDYDHSGRLVLDLSLSIDEIRSITKDLSEKLYKAKEKIRTQ
jgi:hypothetical protein